MFAHRLLNLMLFLVVASVFGCNSAAVMQKNIERTAQNWGKPKEQPFPMHPYASERGDSARPDAPRLASPVVEKDEPLRDVDSDHDDVDDDDAIIQTGGQMPLNTGTGIISGRVVDSSGRPQPNVSVVASATRRPGSARAEVITDARGNFALRGLEPGQRYLVLASAIRSSSSLIGRVSSVPPDQGVVIEITAPFAANRESVTRAKSTPVIPREPSGSRTGSTVSFRSPIEERPGDGPRLMHSQNPFADGGESTASKATARADSPATARPQPTKRTRDQALADNRLESPWDMPAPSTRKSPAATTTKSEPISRGGPESSWKPAGGGRPVQLSAKPRQKVLETPQAEITPTDPESEAVTSRDAPPSNPDPRRPLTQPIEIATAKPDRPRALMTKANVPLEPAEPETLAAPSNSPQKVYDGPMCEFDGKRLVDFQLTDTQGRTVTFKGINGRLVLIDFWTTWCGPCLRAMPHLVSLQRRYGPHGLQVIGIACEQGSSDERVARVAQTGEQLAINYPLLLDEGGDKFMVRDKFGVGVYPTLILLDHSGNVLWRSEGPDQADMQQLEKLLKTQLTTASTGYN